MSVNDGPSRFRMMILVLITISTAVFLIYPVSADPTFVTIATKGDQSYYLGEKVVLSGVNSNSDSTYLYITGPNIPGNGGKLSSPSHQAISGDSGSFTIVTVKPDKTWEYSWYTSNLILDAGTYTLYAASQPKAIDQLADTAYGTTGTIIKKPFITAGISPSPVIKGQPFTINGTAEGIPAAVKIWIFGKSYAFTTITTVNPDASFTFPGDAALSGKLPSGQNYLVVQHPMADNEFDVDVSGEFVRSQQPDNGTNLFKITGPGSLQGSDAADALIAAISDREIDDKTYSHDTYTIVPFQVTDAGAPVRQTTQQAPLQYALLGSIVVAAGIVLWKRH